MLGDQKYEHSQNVTLQRVLNAVFMVNAVGADTPVEGETAQAAAVRVNRGLNAWSALQDAVNALIDSTTAQNADQQVGGNNDGHDGHLHSRWLL